MSTTYIIEIETSYNLIECRNVLLPNIELEVITEKPTKSVLRTPHFHVSIEQLPYEEAFSLSIGMKPSIRITIFREKSFVELVKMFMHWVHGSKDTAILIFNYEMVYLLWKNGELIRNRDPDLWFFRTLCRT